METGHTISSSVDYDFDTAICRVRVEGRLDQRGATDLRHRVHKALAEHPLAVIINLDGVTGVDELSGGVFPVMTRLHDSPPILVCSSPQSECGRLLRGTSYPLVPNFETDAAAVAALAAEAPARFHLHLRGDDSAPAQARRLARRAFEEWDAEALCPAAEVIISELVSNSVRHAKSDIEVTIAKGRYNVHLHVRDRSALLPILPSSTQNASRDNRGMRLVDHFATAWGTTLTPYGKTVWVTLAMRHPSRRG